MPTSEARRGQSVRRGVKRRGETAERGGDWVGQSLGMHSGGGVFTPQGSPEWNPICFSQLREGKQTAVGWWSPAKRATLQLLIQANISAQLTPLVTSHPTLSPSGSNSSVTDHTYRQDAKTYPSPSYHPAEFQPMQLLEIKRKAAVPGTHETDYRGKLPCRYRGHVWT